MTEPLPLTADGDGYIMPPCAAKNAIVSMELDAKNRPRRRIRITTAPEDGKANRTVIQLLSKSWKIPASCFTLRSGDTARYKRIRIAAPYHEIAICLTT